MTAAAWAGVSGFASTAVGSTSVTLPLVGNKVGKVVLQTHTGAGGVAPIMHFTAPVYPINRLAMPQKSTVTAVTLEHQGVAPCRTLHHGVQVPGGPLV